MQRLAGELLKLHAQRAQAEKVVAEQIEAQGLSVAGWREVPVDSSVCGPIALDSLPAIEQVFVVAQDSSLSEQELNRSLFVAKHQSKHNSICITLFCTK